MSLKLKELHDQQCKSIAEARAILDQPTTTDEELARADELMNESEKLGKDIERVERANAAQKSADEYLASSPENRKVIDTEPERATSSNGGLDRNSEDYRSSFKTYLRRGKNGIFSDDIRALQVGTDSEGGYLVPTEFANQLVVALTDRNIVRELATVINTSSGSMEIPVVSAHGTASWTAEEASITASDETFAQATLSAYKAGTIVLVSSELVNDSAFNLESYLVSEFARRVGDLEEAAFVNGDGSSKPSGITDAAGTGVTAAGAAAITSDELLDLYHSLGRPYRANASFMMADATAKAIRKLKDSDGVYIWNPGLQAGQPDVLLGRPVYTSDNVEAMTTGLKSVIFADFSYYWIGDRGARSFQRLNELYAATDQVGFKGTQRVDGKLTLAAAAKVLVQA